MLNACWACSFALTSAAAAGPPSLLANGGFEMPALAAGAFRYAPKQGQWIFGPGAGISGNDSAFTAGNPPAREGRQVAFLQNAGSIQQLVYLALPGYYGLDLKSAQRANLSYPAPAQTIRLLVDGATVGDYRPPTTGYTNAYRTFYAPAGIHSITLSGLARAGDQTAFVDDVGLNRRSWGFWDPGLVDGAVKSAYLTPTKGTREDPLSLPTPCLWADADPLLIPNNTCSPQPSAYSSSFPFWENTTWDSDARHWAFVVNNEPTQNLCNPGAPDLSIPRSSPGSGIAGFVVLRDSGETFNRAHLVLDQTAGTNPCRGGITFMAFGAQANRGNVDPIVALNPRSAPSTIAFTAKLWAFEPDSPSWFRLVLLTGWPDASGRWVPRQIQLNLFGGGLDGFLDRHWNWPVQDNLFPHGGADIAIVDANIASRMCGIDLPLLMTAGEEIAYTINIDSLFRCVSDHDGFSDRMPSTPDLAVYGVHWAVENAAPPTVAVPGAIWVSVHGMRTF